MICPECDKCGRELDAPGALAFSPPVLTGVVRKIHICIACWRDFEAWLNPLQEINIQYKTEG
jgi:hypothetical protein